MHHARQTVLFKDGEVWRKKESLFDVSMGAYDGAEVAELVGLLILSNVKEKMPYLNFGLYRDDGLATYKTTRGTKVEAYRKSLTKIFKDLGLKITLEFEMHEVNYLDVTFNLAEQNYRPYRKPNDTPLYIHRSSNHPPTIKKQLPAMIAHRLSEISSNEEIFNESVAEYNAALKKSGYKEDVKYKQKEPTTTKRKARKRKIVWYNPPFNASITVNLGKQFLILIDKHFPKEKPRPDKLEKIINRHTLKLSYSCMPNMKTIIAGHNAKILRKTGKKKEDDPKGCNCQKSKKANCPIPGRCKEEALVYKATIVTTDKTERYIGSTENSFKSRYYGHAADMREKEKEGGTTLSTYYWKKANEGNAPTVSWEILRKCSKYKKGSRNCDVCLTEKLEILKTKEKLLNKRTELMYKCPHRRKHRLMMFDETPP